MAEYLEPGEPSRSTTPAGEQPPTEEGQPALHLVVCPSCDEIFAPQFYRRCAYCGFDEGGGLEPAPPPISHELSPREAIVAATLVLFALAAIAYFRWLL